MAKKYQVLQIDAWAYGDDWVYNNVIPLGKVYIEGEPSKVKILNALRRNNYLAAGNNKDYAIDDSYIDTATWSLVKSNDYMPLFDLVEIA